MRPETIGQNRQLMEEVFAEIHAQLLEGLRYALSALEDGSFSHVVETASDVNPVPQLEAFKERCAEPRNAADASVLGNNRMLGKAQ